MRIQSLLVSLMGLMLMSSALASPSQKDTYFHFSFFNDNFPNGNGTITVELNGEVIYDDLSVQRLELKTFTRALLPGVKNQLRVNKQAGMKFGVSIVNEGYLSQVDDEVQTAFWVDDSSATDVTYEIILVNEAVINGEGARPLGMATPLQVSDLDWKMGLGNLRNGNAAGFIEYSADDLLTASYKRGALGLHIPPVNAGEIIAHFTDEDSDGIEESLRQVKVPQGLIDITDDGDGVGFTIAVYSGGSGGNATTLYTPVGTALVSYRFDELSNNQLTLIQADNASNVVTSTVVKTNDGTYDDWTLTIAGTGVTKRLVVDNSNSSGNRAERRTFDYSAAPSGSVTEATKSYVIEDTYIDLPDFEDLEPEDRLYQRTFNEGVSGQERTTDFRYYTTAEGFDGENQYGRLKSYETHFGEWRFYEYHNPGLVEVVTNPSSPLYDRQIYDFLRWSKDNFYFEAYHGIHALNGKRWFESKPEGDSLNFDVDGSNAQIFSAYPNTQLVLSEAAYGQDWRLTNPRLVSSQGNISSSNTDYRVERELTRAYTFPVDTSDTTGEFIQVVYDAYTDKKRTNASLNHFQYTDAVRYTAQYKPHQNAKNFDFNYSNKPYYVVDRNNTKSSFGYKELSSYEGISNAWVEVEVKGTGTELQPIAYLVNVTSPYTNQTYNSLDVHNALWILEVLGNQSSTQISLYNQMNSDLVDMSSVTHGGESFDLDAVTLISGKSTKRVRAYNDKGQLKRQESWVRTSANQWELTEVKRYLYDAFSRLTDIYVSDDGTLANEHHSYQCVYDGIWKDYEINNAGIKTDYTVDGLGRVVEAERSSGHSVAGIPTSITTLYQYDSFDRVVREEVDGASESLVTLREYDAEGLMVKEVDPHNITSTYSYSQASGAGRQVDITYAAGTTESRTEQQIFHKDGRLKSRTGTALVPEYHSYSYDLAGGTNGLETQTDIGLPSTSSADHPVQTTLTDWYGRPLEESSTTATNSDYLKNYTYSNDATYTGLLTETLETQVATGGTTGGQSLKSYFDYDGFGNVTRSGVDVNGSNSLTLSSTDRITESDTLFKKSGGVVFSETSLTVYPEDNSATGFTSSQRKELTGFNSTTLSKDIAEDVYGNETTTTVTVNRTTGTLTTTVNPPDTTVDGVETHVMGFLVSRSTPSGQIYGFTYDDLGRPVLQTQNRASGSATQNEYQANESRVWKTTTGLPLDGVATADFPGQTITFSYDAAGRLGSQTDPASQTTYFDYNNRSQLTHTWGENVQPLWNEYDSFGQLETQHTYRVDPSDSGAPDFMTATWPSGVGNGDETTFDYFYEAGLLRSRTDAKNRQTSFTYDQRGRLRTRITPSASNDAQTTATNQITTTYHYAPKTDELTSVSYSNDGGMTPDLGYTYHRTGELKTVTDGAGTRTFHYEHGSTTSANALQMIQEDLPSAYTTISNAATNDSQHKVDALAYSYQATTSGAQLKGRAGGTSLGLKSATEGILGTTRYSQSYSYEASTGRLGGLTNGTQNLTYGYVPASNLIQTRTVGSLVETRSYLPDRNLLDVIKTEHGSNLKVSSDYSYDNLSRRQDVLQTGEHFAPYCGSLFTDYTYNERSELTDIDVYSATEVDSSKLLPGRGWGFKYDLMGNRLSETRKQVELNGSTVDRTYTYTSNQLNQYSSRQTPEFGEAAGTAPAEVLLSAGRTSPLELSNVNRVHGYFHRALPVRSWQNPSNSNPTHFDATLYGVKLGAGGADTANPGEDKDLIEEGVLPLTLRAATETIKHDARGNLTQDSLYSYTWDAENRLIEIESTSAAQSSGAPAVKVEFAYDYLNRRYRKDNYVTSGGSISGSVQDSRLFYYNGFALVYDAHYQRSGGTSFLSSHRNYWGVDWSGTMAGAGGVGGLVGQQSREAGGADNEVTFPSHDGNGNILGLYEADGTTVAAYEYSPFGKMLRSSGERSADNKFRFASKYYEDETKLYYHDLRFYSPSLGRFLSEDPAAASQNLYVFVNNSPIDLIDVLGLETFFEFQSGVNRARSDFNQISFESGFNERQILTDLQNSLGVLSGFEENVDRLLLEDAFIDLALFSLETVQMRRDFAQNRLVRATDAANAGFRELFAQAAAIEREGGLAPGTVDPRDDINFFDTNNSEFKAAQRNSFLLAINPSSQITLKAVRGEYGGASVEFVKQVALASVFSIGGEALLTGRVAFGAGRIPSFSSAGLNSFGGVDELSVIALQPTDDVAFRSAQLLAAARGEGVVSLESAFVSTGAGGLTTVVAHGSGSRLAGLTYRQFADALRQNGFNGVGVELVACKCGSGPFAQGLANTLRVPVIAARGNVNVLGGVRGVPQVVQGGRLLQPGQGFVTVKPQRGIRAALFGLRHGN
ncbi:RHS repeat-associated core domain-containing protein [Roseibacillus persicicus]|uniref:RHS repeat-associated core domain-containing protein n=1 Tax=Roseibacillus persicicus TaxID=454148 RepID=UPI00398B3B20